MFPDFDVSEPHRIAYLIMRKCGCSSFRHAISNIRDAHPIRPHQTEIHWSQQTSCYLASQLPAPETWFKFTFIRDPIVRFLSFYNSKILNQNLFENHTFIHFDRFGLLPNMSIDQVVDILLDDSFETEPHAVSQTDWLAAVGYELDYVGRMERMTESIAEIAEISGAVLRPDKLNGSKQKHFLPTRAQFKRLANFYRRDIESFGYPDTYDSWYAANVVGKEDKYQLEPGFTFQNEAKLIGHRISTSPRGYEIALDWRVDAHHRRKRMIRVGVQKGRQFRELFRVPANPNLHGCIKNGDGIAKETVCIPFENVPANVDLKDVYHQLFFTQEKDRASLVGYAGHNNMLLLPFGHLRRRSIAKAA